MTPNLESVVLLIAARVQMQSITFCEKPIKTAPEIGLDDMIASSSVLKPVFRQRIQLKTKRKSRNTRLSSLQLLQVNNKKTFYKKQSLFVFFICTPGMHQTHPTTSKRFYTFLQELKLQPTSGNVHLYQFNPKAHS